MKAHAAMSFFHIVIFCLSATAVELGADEPTSGPAGEFQPVATGAIGQVNAKNGDAKFLAEYFVAPDFSGQPVASRFETSVGADRTPIPGSAQATSSARWTATVTPSRSGSFQLALRATGPALLMVDGKVVIRSPADFTKRNVEQVEMARGKPYEIVVEFANFSSSDQVALEWSPPAESDHAAVAREGRAQSVVGPPAGTTIGAASQMENALYRAESKADGTLLLTEKSTGAAASFAPVFDVVFQPEGHEVTMDPKGGKYTDDGPVGQTNYVVPSWAKETDYLVAAQPRTTLRASSAVMQDGKLLWKFPDQPAYSLTADVVLPADGGEPVLTFHFQAAKNGQFSVGYVGAPAVAPTDFQWIWQPLIWQDKRFPNQSYLTKEFECPIPFVMMGSGGNAIGVGVDAKEMPYRMPTIDNSRFGVLVRNAAGQAQPQVFAPILAGPESQITSGKSYDFALRLFVAKGAWFDGYKHLAQTLYHFGDIRENGLCSLNTTIDNMVDYMLNDTFSCWYPKYKTYSYQNDGGPEACAQRSAADVEEIARVCDSSDYFKRRALPTLEYMLSRNSLTIKFSKPTYMGGFINNPSDLSAAYGLTGRRTTVIRDLLMKKAPKAASDSGDKPISADKSALNKNLAYYQLTGDAIYLKQACAAADRYIAERVDEPAENYSDLGSSFWTEMAPSYDLLYELYDLTGNKKYLQASAAAMKQFTGYTYLVPVIPDGNFVSNPGGVYNDQPVPEETVPAWRVSANGLAPECAGTAHSHRGVFMVYYAGYMNRLWRDIGETFFRDIARNAIVGRYANYPSYAYRDGYGTVYEKPDYPLHSFAEIKKFTSIHYDHPPPMTCFLIDYLVSDVYARSDAKITFPSDFTNTGAYFRNKVYGIKPGQFYDESGVNLWLPKGLLKADSIQVNHLTGYGNGKLYVALTNQSAQPVTTTIHLDPTRVKLAGTHAAKVWINNTPSAEISVVDGSVPITVPGKGITCLAIDKAEVHTEITQAMLDPASPPLPEGSSQTVETPFDSVTATALRFGRGLTSVHVWLKANPDQVKHASLKYTAGGKSEQMECDAYPFEFTVPVLDDEDVFRCTVHADTPGGGADSPELAVHLK